MNLWLSWLLVMTSSVTAGLATRPSEAGATRAVHEVRLEVGGATIRALCTEGRRAVVLLHGEAGSADAWRPVLERLDGSVGACAYDRRGSGGSGPVPGERGWYELVDELRRIHLALGFERDYVLVGHGLGGLYARLYAADRDQIGGLLLVEPSHEDMPEEVRAGMPRREWEAWIRAREETNTDGVSEADVGHRARATRLPPIPVTVVTATRRREGNGWDARFVNEAARRVHASILRGVTSARHVPASRSGPDVNLDEPDLVAEEIQRLVRIARTRGR